MHTRLALAVVLVAGFATPAAAQRISFPEFSGRGAAAVRNQLVSAVCDTAECVAATKTTTRQKPDWKKAKKEAVQFFVTGAVARKGKGLQLTLAVLSRAGPPRTKKAFPLDKGGALAPRQLQAAVELLASTFGASAPAPAPAPAPRPAPVEPPRVAPAPAPARPPPAPPVAEAPPASVARDEAEPEPEPPTRRGEKFLFIDVGAELTSRKLDYAQATTANLRRYELPLYAQPALGVEFYPLALLSDGLASGLGVDLSLATAPYLQSRRASAPDTFPTTALRVDGGLRFRIMPLEGYRLALVPYAGVRVQSFTVGALPDGTRLDGLPNVSFTGLRVGLGLELPLGTDLLMLTGRFGVVPVFSAGEILSAAFFPRGSAFGVEASGGLAVQVAPFLQVRASFDFTSWGLTFQGQDGDTYRAAGATERYLGGSAALRFML